MPTLNIKPNHKSITAYYAALDRYQQHGVTHETAVRAAFQALLDTCARQRDWTLICEYTLRIPGRNPLRLDGAMLDEHSLPRGTWEAKGVKGNLRAEIEKKFNAGYPQDNILFQTPERAILYQNGHLVLDENITEPSTLVSVLEAFFSYERENAAEWEAAVAEFKVRVPELGREAQELIKKQHRTNTQFQTAFADFHQLCQAAINPNLSKAAVEEMLIQHLLTERTFRTVFNTPDFTRRNVIAREIEKVIDALASKAFSRGVFLQKLDRFYRAIEREAATLVDFAQKQHFLNTVYEQFFQGFSIKKADTHGIVYTPQPIVDFMVKSVEQLLKTEFGRSLADEGVHIIDAFVGTGNFIVRLMREIPKTKLEAKYRSEIWCNEVLLLPYYIASLNIEHEFYDTTTEYLPFKGISLVDTFDLAEDRQISLLTIENTERVEKQKAAPMFIVIGNPPYNVGQKNENDNNKNQKYPALNKRVQETYSQASAASTKKALGDAYVKAIRWAADRIGEEGIIALVTNRSFLDSTSFDGMRKHLAEEFDALWLLDLGGNARKDKLASNANVFSIQVGVSINLFVKNPCRRDLPAPTSSRRDLPVSISSRRDLSAPTTSSRRGLPVSTTSDRKTLPAPTARIFYYRTDDTWNKSKKFEFLAQTEHVGNIEWQTLQPDKRHTWLTEGLQADFDTFIPIGSQTAKKSKGEVSGAIFHQYGIGCQTARDAWLYNFNRTTLTEKVKCTIDTYNMEMLRWQGTPEVSRAHVDDFVVDDNAKIKWSSGLKQKLVSGQRAEFSPSKIRRALFRPFTKTNLFFDNVLTHRKSIFPITFPNPETEGENRVICVPGPGGRAPFWCCVTNVIPNTALITLDANQCFPFYIYDEDGTNRRENITDWALENFRAHYGDDTLTKWDIFNYTYGILHHPDYRERYTADLKRDLPHLPYAEDFRAFADAGAQLAELHVHYETQPQYPLTFVENATKQLDFRVKRMKLSKDKTQLIYNQFLTLEGIPQEALAYRLGQYSALEWVVNQYRVKSDPRSGIVNDPSDAEKPRYIVNLIGSVITVSLETLKIIEALPDKFRGP